VRLGGHRSGRQPGRLFLQKRIVRHRRVSINSICGMQQSRLFCDRQGELGCAPCSAKRRSSAPWPRAQIDQLTTIGVMRVGFIGAKNFYRWSQGWQGEEPMDWLDDAD